MRSWPPQIILVLSLFAYLVPGSSPVAAQVTILPPRPTPLSPNDVGNIPSPPGPPLGVVPAPSPSPLTYTPAPPLIPAPPVDPGPNGWGVIGGPSQNQGVFFDAQLNLVFPHLQYRATNDNPLPITGAVLHVPTQSLSTTVSPTIEAGYRLANSNGLFAINYTFLNADGNGALNSDSTPYNVRTRVSINSVDFDYGTTPYEFAPRYTYSYRLGFRASEIYFDSQATNPVISQGATNKFFGVGPHLRLDVERRVVPVPGLSLYGRLDGAVLIGRVSQTYHLQTTAADGTTLTDMGQANRTQAAPQVNLQLGLSYAPESIPGLKFISGYDFTDIWNVGRLGENPAGMVSQTRGQFWSHGVFLRAQYDF